jgi:hypothetical protein
MNKSFKPVSVTTSLFGFSKSKVGKRRLANSHFKTLNIWLSISFYWSFLWSSLNKLNTSYFEIAINIKSKLLWGDVWNVYPQTCRLIINCSRKLGPLNVFIYQLSHSYGIGVIGAYVW